MADKTVHLPCEQLLDIYLLYHMYGDDELCHFKKLIFMLRIRSAYCVQWMQLWPVLSALSTLSIWHKLNTLSCQTCIMLKGAEWQLYLRLQTGGNTEKGLLCNNLLWFLQNTRAFLLRLDERSTEVSHLPCYFASKWVWLQLIRATHAI